MQGNYTTEVQGLGQMQKRRIYPANVIRSDGWKIDGKYYEHHEPVNHKKHYIDPVTGVHSNTIEGTWNAVKKIVPARKKRTTKEGVKPCLLEFMWRHQNIR